MTRSALRRLDTSLSPDWELTDIAGSWASHLVKKTSKDFVDRTERWILLEVPRDILHDLRLWPSIHHLWISVRPIAPMM